MKRCYSCFKEYGENFDVCPYCGTVYNPKPIEPIQLIPGTPTDRKEFPDRSALPRYARDLRQATD